MNGGKKFTFHVFKKTSKFLYQTFHARRVIRGIVIIPAIIIPGGSSR